MGVERMKPAARIVNPEDWLEVAFKIAGERFLECGERKLSIKVLNRDVR